MTMIALLDYATIVIGISVIIVGALCIVLSLLLVGDEIIRRIMTHLRGYDALCDFAWRRKEFKEWVKRGKP